jgi:hypothetical protein
MGVKARHRVVLALARAVMLAGHPLQVFHFVRKIGYLPDPAWPRWYNELFLWRKIVDRNPLFVTLSDKLAAKERAQELVPELLVARVLWTGSEADALPAELLTGDVVVKTTHGCGHNVFVSGSTPPRPEVVSKLKRWLRQSHHRHHGQWAYRDVPRRAFVEERLALGEVAGMPTEVKVHVFAGKIGLTWTADKKRGLSRSYRPDGTAADMRDREYPAPERALPDSPALRDIVRQATGFALRLAGDIDHLRVDFMVAAGRLYFGEATVYSAAGYDMWFDPALARGAELLWDLRWSDFLRRQQRGARRIYATALRAALDAERGPQQCVWLGA